ncbi:hypothetical protein HGM15179_012277 [Zosterops borbonicus]|uniref:Uncharacterized protein n=1 Tax=Zosterops borbonicus TaxID=364589 RepID=A0A8K1GA55_9PASS|nr:hypothetical protein HGM15179_012277 [Zosterops borbonicus]
MDEEKQLESFVDGVPEGQPHPVQQFPKLPVPAAPNYPQPEALDGGQPQPESKEQENKERGLSGMQNQRSLFPSSSPRRDPELSVQQLLNQKGVGIQKSNEGTGRSGLYNNNQ